MKTETLDDTRTRLRLLVVLFIAAGINRTGYIAAITVTALAAEDMLASARWSGLAAAAATLGIAAGTARVSAYMSKVGRRLGYVVAQLVAVVGAVLAIVAIQLQTFPLFLVGLFVFGVGASGERLGRYAAADVAPPHRRASAIAWIVFAGTIGAVLGPRLLGPAETQAVSFGLDGLVGGFLVGAAFVLAGAVLIFFLLRPDPLDFAPKAVADAQGGAVSIGLVLRRPVVVYGLISLAVGQSVMTMIMAMTPVHIRAAGGAIGMVGLVISVHTLGMFFFSPLTGWLVDKSGPLRVILAGQFLLLGAAALAAPAAGDQLVLLLPALFLLGLGWNFGFVGGSALVNAATEGDARLRLQGIADAITWVSSAVAAVTSGLILDAGGFSRLVIVGGLLVLLPLAVRLRVKQSVAAESTVDSN